MRWALMPIGLQCDSLVYNQSMSAKRIEMLSGIVLGEICFKNEWRRQ